MKKITGFIALFIAALVINTSALAAGTNDPQVSGITEMDEAKWEAFSESLVKALASGHLGLQQGALRMIIQYGDYVDVEAALFDVMKVYRDNQDDNMRRMAVVALGKMKSKMAVQYLERAVSFERSPKVKKTMLAVIMENRAS
jgi:hypothetical protein